MTQGSVGQADGKTETLAASATSHRGPTIPRYMYEDLGILTCVASKIWATSGGRGSDNNCHSDLHHSWGFEGEVLIS